MAAVPRASTGNLHRCVDLLEFAAGVGKGKKQQRAGSRAAAAASNLAQAAAKMDRTLAGPAHIPVGCYNSGLLIPQDVPPRNEGSAAPISAQGIGSTAGEAGQGEKHAAV
jgi:hypothetical protein